MSALDTDPLSSYFVCGGSDGGAALFSLERAAPLRVLNATGPSGSSSGGATSTFTFTFAAPSSPGAGSDVALTEKAVWEFPDGFFLHEGPRSGFLVSRYRFRNEKVVCVFSAVFPAGSFFC